MKLNVKKPRQIILIVFTLSFFSLQAQVQRKVESPDIRNFMPIVQFLASPLLEGRETGTAGSYIAADYIASGMQSMGLKPYHKVADYNKTTLSDYFQSFSLVRYDIREASFSIVSRKNKQPPVQLLHKKDFTVENVFSDFSVASGFVFAGYGINPDGLNYNDYAGQKVYGKLVVVLDGYPGQHDTLSPAWMMFRNLAENDAYDLNLRCREAAKQGAAAIVVISNKSNQSKTPDDARLYHDSEYTLPSNEQLQTIPLIMLTAEGSRILSERLRIDVVKIEKEIAQKLAYSSVLNIDFLNIRLKVNADTLKVHNVISILPGSDTTKTVILGAHYDHLGKRGNDIYYGADDNASGVAGLLALAGKWTENLTIPPCNIAFASWTAEEKGLIGSEYFVSTLSVPDKVKLYINMDMISRSILEDTAGRQLSIGTRTTDEYLRELASRSNSTLKHPFTLDLWDVTGHSGSDYASFTAKNIPIMTYNSGLHDDYHTPRDIPANIDAVKMGNVLKLINFSLQDFLSGIK